MTTSPPAESPPVHPGPPAREPAPAATRLRALAARPATALPALAALAVLVSVAGLFTFPATLDEAYVYALTQHGLTGLLDGWREDPQALLPQLIALPFGAADAMWALRLPSLIAFAAAVAATWWAARPLAGPLVAAGGAALMALSPLGTATATDARWPAWALLTVVLAWGALLRAARTGAPRWWVLYALALATGIWANALVVLMVPAHALALLALTHRRRLLPWLASLAAPAAAAIPLALAVRASDAPNPLVRTSVPTLTEVPGFLATLVATGAPERIRQLATLACVLVVAAGLVTLRRRDTGARAPRPAPPRQAVVLLGWAVLPLAAAFLISQTGDSVWQGRYVLGVLPAAGLLVTWSAVRIGGRVGVALWAAVAIGFAGLTGHVHLRAQGEPTDSWAALLAAQSPPGAAVIFSEAEGVQAAGYYEPRFRTAEDEVIVPAWDRTPVPDGIVLLDHPTFDRLPPAPPSAALVRRLANLHGIVTMALRPPSVQAPGVRWAERNCLVERTMFDGALIVAVRDCRLPARGTRPEQQR